uniref:Small integral membrane protein 13 n=1 Tax=Homo sapiens TaxID=9606 RepID=A0ABB0MV34_HUMAN
MWHSVGLTLLVFVATLLIVLLLMVCESDPLAKGGHLLMKATDP